MLAGELFDQSLKLWWYISLEDLQTIQPTLPFREQLVLLIKMENLYSSSFIDKSPERDRTLLYFHRTTERDREELEIIHYFNFNNRYRESSYLQLDVRDYQS